MTNSVTLPRQFFYKNHLITFQCHSLVYITAPRTAIFHEKTKLFAISEFSVNISFMENSTNLIVFNIYIHRAKGATK